MQWEPVTGTIKQTEYHTSLGNTHLVLTISVAILMCVALKHGLCKMSACTCMPLEINGVHFCQKQWALVRLVG